MIEIRRPGFWSLLLGADCNKSLSMVIHASSTKGGGLEVQAFDCSLCHSRKVHLECISLLVFEVFLRV